MKIINTGIPDVTYENLDQTKINLSNQIIENVFPLFDEVLIGKKDEVKRKQKELDNKRMSVFQTKENLENKMKEYNRYKKVKKLLERISKLVSSGLTFDSNLKHEMVVLLKIIHKIPDEKVDFHLSETLKIINKRFSRL